MGRHKSLERRIALGGGARASTHLARDVRDFEPERSARVPATKPRIGPGLVVLHVLAKPRRKDYFDDPRAPSPSIVEPGAGGAVFDEQGRILLVRRSDNGRWALPGGRIDPHESVSDAVVREIEEETGLRVDVTGLIGIYSDPRHVVVYDQGDVRREFFLLCRCRMLGGSLRRDEESSELRFFAAEDALGLALSPGQRRRIEDAFGQPGDAVVR